MDSAKKISPLYSPSFLILDVGRIVCQQKGSKAFLGGVLFWFMAAQLALYISLLGYGMYTSPTAFTTVAIYLVWIAIVAAVTVAVSLLIFSGVYSLAIDTQAGTYTLTHGVFPLCRSRTSSLHDFSSVRLFRSLVKDPTTGGRLTMEVIALTWSSGQHWPGHVHADGFRLIALESKLEALTLTQNLAERLNLPITVDTAEQAAAL